MRTPMPLRWIEEAESRQVRALARHEAPVPPSLAANELLAPWVERLRRWVLSARPQQIGQRGDTSQAAEIVDDVENRLDLAVAEPGERH